MPCTTADKVVPSPPHICSLIHPAEREALLLSVYVEVVLSQRQKKWMANPPLLYFVCGNCKDFCDLQQHFSTSQARCQSRKASTHRVPPYLKADDPNCRLTVQRFTPFFFFFFFLSWRASRPSVRVDEGVN